MEKKKILALIGQIEKSLLPVFEDPRLCTQYAWWILQAITKKNEATLIAEDEITLTGDQQKTLDTWLDKMVNEHMPLQYLLGNVPFYDLEILVEPPILIPRSETEEWTIALIEKLKPLKDKKLNILDLCCGSGCIALALAKALPKAHVYAADISERALALARKNAKHNKITNVTFIHSDLYNELDKDIFYDVIVSNPPYIAFDEWQDLDASVTTWEDPQALIAADKGLAIIEDIILDAADYLNSNEEMQMLQIPQIWIEIGYSQAKDVIDFYKSFNFSDVQVRKDLEGKDRCVTARYYGE